MSTATAQLIAAYEALSDDEKQGFVKDIFRRLPPVGSGAIDDADVAAAGDQLAALLDQEESD
jgi:hypothetical protein